jgi:hypothetical protein
LALPCDDGSIGDSRFVWRLVAVFFFRDYCPALLKLSFGEGCLEALKKKMTPKEYRKYLESEAWKKLRVQAIRRAGGRCQLCNVEARSLQVHHRTYERIGCELLDDLTVLCAPCHRKHHARVLPVDRAERRLEIDEEIVEIVKTAGLIRWREVQRQIKAPKAQAWSRCRRLIKKRELAWKNGMLCLFSQQDLLGVRPIERRGKAVRVTKADGSVEWKRPGDFRRAA